jgi:hypothetical protein
VKKSCFIILIAFLTIHCRNVERGGLDFNGKRAVIGLPLLDSNWRIIDNMDGYIMWAPVHTADSMAFQSKFVRIRNGKVKREENRFAGGQKYKTVDGNFREDLFISCDFDENENVSYWDCEYRGGGHEFGWKISRAQADSILSQWKIAIK